jgi:hypothetical protein
MGLETVLRELGDVVRATQLRLDAVRAYTGRCPDAEAAALSEKVYGEMQGLWYTVSSCAAGMRETKAELDAMYVRLRTAGGALDSGAVEEYMRARVYAETPEALPRAPDVFLWVTLEECLAAARRLERGRAAYTLQLFGSENAPAETTFFVVVRTAALGASRARSVVFMFRPNQAEQTTAAAWRYEDAEAGLERAMFAMSGEQHGYILVHE